MNKTLPHRVGEREKRKDSKSMLQPSQPLQRGPRKHPDDRYQDWVEVTALLIQADIAIVQ